MGSLTPTVVVYDRGNSWQLASLGGPSPRRVVVCGRDGLLALVCKAFPEAEVRVQGDDLEGDWADLIVAEPMPANAPRGWVERLLTPTR